MHSAKNYLIGFLVLTTVAGVIVSWQQYQELSALRAAALNPKERADWQQRLWDAEKRRAEAERQLEGKFDAGRAESTDPSTPADSLPATAGPRAGDRGSNRARFAAMMEQPEVQRLMAVQQRAALDSRYAALFKNLALTPEQLEKLKSLLVEKSTAVADVMMAAREQGINPRQDREAFRQLIDGAQSDIDAAIRSTLGETAFSQYQDYERTLPQRGVVDQLEQRLSYSRTPLTAEQSNQVLGILAASQPPTSGAGQAELGLAGRGPLGPFVARGSAAITDQALEQASGVLAAPQIEALRQLQQEQQAQRELTNAFRNQASEQGVRTRAPAPPPPPDGG